MPGPTLLRLLTLTLALFGAFAHAPALAQDGSPAGSAADEAPAQGGLDAVGIEVETFGLSGVVRPGAWAPVRLVLTDGSTTGRPRDVAVRLHVPDGDGDTTLYERRITLQPGRRGGVWLYAMMPWSMPTTFTVTVNELADSDVGIGPQIAARRIAPSRPVQTRERLIGVVGPATVGLEQYEMGGGTSGRRYHSNLDINVIPGLVPAGMPDRWEGLAAFDTIVWTGGDPTDLGIDLRPRAIREWVRRGGHLVVLLPEVGGVWFTRDDPLDAIMPEVDVVRHEDVSYEPYRNLITTREFDNTPLPMGTIFSFEREQETDPLDAAPLFSGPEGTVAVRRLVGTGMVTVVGLNLDDRDLRLSRAVRADTIWNRILGLRVPMPPDSVPAPPRQVAESSADGQISPSIENTAEAGVGVLLALVVFGVYWLLAGPLGFALLKAKHWHRHAWVAFLISVGVFTVSAWIGASTLADRSLRARHTTFLTHVYGQSFQTTHTFAGVTVDGYGERSFSVGDGVLDAGLRNLISVWYDPRDMNSITPFPDARRYVADESEPEVMGVPVRSTVKRIRADWAGGVRWQTPRPESTENEPRLIDDRAGLPELAGRLVHDLPGDLQAVKVYLVWGQSGSRVRPATNASSVRGILYPNLRRWELSGSWAPGAALDLAQITGTSTGVQVGENYFANLTPQASAGGWAQPSPLREIRSYSRGAAVDNAERLSWMSLLAPPSYANTSYERERVYTEVGHALDISKFATQPALIIIGHVFDAQSPTPLKIGPESARRSVPTEGHTVVRWIYPLTPGPVDFPPTP